MLQGLTYCKLTDVFIPALVCGTAFSKMGKHENLSLPNTDMFWEDFLGFFDIQNDIYLFQPSCWKKKKLNSFFFATCDSFVLISSDKCIETVYKRLGFYLNLKKRERHAITA